MIHPSELRMFALSIHPQTTHNGLILNPLSSAGFYLAQNYNNLSIGMLCVDEITKYPFYSGDEINDLIKGDEIDVFNWGKLMVNLLVCFRLINGQYKYIREEDRRWDEPVFKHLVVDGGKYLEDYNYIAYGNGAS